MTTTQDTNRRLSANVVNQDVDALNGLKSVQGYNTTRSGATTEALQQTYQAMLTQQQNEAEQQAIFKAVADAARLAEWDFHNAVLVMKEVVRGQFGSDSDQAQAVGLKKKSERKRPSKQKIPTS